MGKGKAGNGGGRVSVQWQDDDPDICDLGVSEAMDEAAASLRCLVYWLLPSALLGAALWCWLIWLAYQWMIGG